MSAERREGGDPKRRAWYALWDRAGKDSMSELLEGMIKRGEVTREEGIQMGNEIIESHLRSWKQVFDGKSHGMVMGDGDADIQGALFQLENLEQDAHVLDLDLQTTIDEARAALYRRFPRARNLQPKRFMK